MTPIDVAQSLDLPRRSVALVLAGGRGSRLKNLTDSRAKPAVYFGGKFRIVDLLPARNASTRSRGTSARPTPSTRTRTSWPPTRQPTSSCWPATTSTRWTTR